ncbi:hypothetical protein Tco_1260884 [Tanacetum coccineum]
MVYIKLLELGMRHFLLSCWKMALGEVKQQPDGIFISQDKYVADILKKFDFCSIKIATTPIVSNKPLGKDEYGVDVDVHVYRFQVTPKASHLNAVKRIFSNYKEASLDRKSTTGGCQFLGRRLISWQCKKQTIMANYTTEAEYVAATKCCGQVHLFRGGTSAGQHLVLLGLVYAAQKYFRMEMMFGLGKKMLLGLVLEAISVSMANLEFVDQHNMVVCLEKTEGNSDFHEIVDFLASSSIHHALTVSPTIYTSYIEQFWNTASSQTVNDVKQINATVDRKAVVVT